MIKQGLNPVIIFIAKVFLLSLILAGIYYVLVLIPAVRAAAEREQAKIELARHSALLSQNRIAYSNLVRLHPGSPVFETEKSATIVGLRSSREDALSLLKSDRQVAMTDSRLTSRFPSLLTDTHKFYEDQQQFLGQVFDTRDYQDGITLLKSSESADLLERQTNLLNEFLYWEQILEGQSVRSRWLR